MKRIFLTIMSAVVVATSAYAENQMSFGLKGNGVISGVTKVAENAAQGKESKFLNLGAGGGGYFEYAFHDIVGAGVDIAYAGGVVASAVPKGAKDDKNETSLTQQTLRVLLPYVSITPLGREDKEEIGILFINVGLQHDIRLSAKKTVKKNGTEEPVDKNYEKDGVKSWGLGVGGAIGYEFPFSLTLEIRGGVEFTDYFTDKLRNRTQGKNKKSSNLWNAGMAVGYNLASLME